MSRERIETREARFAFLGREDRPACAELIVRDAPARGRRALQGWLTTWAFAVAAVFLPLLHFVLVPALVIAGPLVALQRWGERVTVKRVSGECPGCGAAQEHELGTPAREGLEVRCASCRRAIRVVLPAELLASAK